MQFNSTLDSNIEPLARWKCVNIEYIEVMSYLSKCDISQKYMNKNIYPHLNLNLP